MLFGFQFNGIFQELFVDLPYPSRVLEACGLTLLMISIAFLVAPSMHHRLVEGGQDNARVLRLATDFAGLALLPLTFALAFDMFVAVAWTLGLVTGIIIGATFFLAAILSWYVLEFLLLRSKKPAMAKDRTVRTPLDVEVDQLLTEARLIIPGAQALLGFQFAVTLMRAFAELPDAVKMLHVAALCCIGLAVILLIALLPSHCFRWRGRSGLCQGCVLVCCCRAVAARVWNCPRHLRCHWSRLGVGSCGEFTQSGGDRPVIGHLVCVPARATALEKDGAPMNAKLVASPNR